MRRILIIVLCLNIQICYGQKYYVATYQHTLTPSIEQISFLGSLIYTDSIHVSDKITISYAGFEVKFSNHTESNIKINNATYFALTDWDAQQYYINKDTGSAVIMVDTWTVRKKLREENFGKWRCTVYSVKEMPGIEVYFSEDVPDIIRPGLVRYLNKPTGGLVFIRHAGNAKTKSSTVELIDFHPISKMADLSDLNIPKLPASSPEPSRSSERDSMK